MTERPQVGPASRVRAGFHAVTVTVGAIGALAAVGMMVHIVAHAGARFLAGTGMQGTLEYVRFWWLMLVVYGALAIAQRRDEHISAPVLFDRVSAPTQRVWMVVGDLITIAVLLLVGWYGWVGAMDAFAIRARAAGSGVPTWPTTYLVPLGAVLYAIELVFRDVDVIRHRVNGTSR